MELKKVLQNKIMRVILSAHYLFLSFCFFSLLKKLNFMSIHDRITYLCGCFVLKALNNLTPNYIETSKFSPINRKDAHETRPSTNGNLQTCKFFTNYCKSKFRYKGAITWNVICPKIRKTASFNVFTLFKSFQEKFEG